MAQDRKLQKLELTWVGKYDEQKPLEPRILIENPENYFIVDLDWSNHATINWLCETFNAKCIE